MRSRIIAASIVLALVVGTVAWVVPGSPSHTEGTPEATQEVPEAAEDRVVLDDERRVTSRGTEFFLPGDERIDDAVGKLLVTATWDDDALDHYEALELSFRSAASRIPVTIGALDVVQPLEIAVDRSMVDVDGQGKSAWSFIVTPVGADPVWFGDDVRLQVTALAGKPAGAAPAIPAPPSELLRVSDRLQHTHYELRNESGDAVSSYFAPFTQYHLSEGARVSADRLAVTVEMEVPMDIRLAYMDADSNGWQWVYPDASQGGQATFLIEVDEDEKDAAIPTGLWRFALAAGTQGGNLGVGSLLHGAAVTDFTMTVTAL